MVSRGIAAEIGAGAARFLSRQRFIVASTLDAQGEVWASLLTGEPGFATAVDPELIGIAGLPPEDDPLRANLEAPSPVGLLAIDLSTRQRVRFNGRGAIGQGGIFLDVSQVYGNCPKYIQRRAIESTETASPGVVRVSPDLGPHQQKRIRDADTFFIASSHDRGGADASHRGGLPGFVRIEGPTRLSFPDYPGNAMFNTLGNLAVQPAAGLLFVDFVNGDTLQLTGRTRLDPDRRVTFDITEVRDTPHASPLRFRFIDFSPANPALEAVTPAAAEASEEVKADAGAAAKTREK